MKKIFIFWASFILLISNLNAQDSNSHKFPTDKNGIAAKFGINGSRVLGFGETKVAYKFGYNGKRYFEAGTSIAFGISSPKNYTRSFMDGLGNQVGIFGTFNYTPGYFFTRLSGKFILSMGLRHFYYESYNLDNLRRTETRELILNGKTGFGLEYKLLENLEVSIANYVSYLLRRQINPGSSNFRKTVSNYLQLSTTYTF